MIIWVLVVALAGVTFGALWVLVMGEQDLLRRHGLTNPISEFQRPNKSIFQALCRLPWAVGFALAQLFSWGFVFLGAMVSAGPVIVAIGGGLVALFAGLGTLSGLLFGKSLTPADWQALREVLCVLTFSATYGLSAYVGWGLIGKEKEE